jgi:hypothetical protein
LACEVAELKILKQKIAAKEGRIKGLIKKLKYAERGVK